MKVIDLELALIFISVLLTWIGFLLSAILKRLDKPTQRTYKRTDRPKPSSPRSYGGERPTKESATPPRRPNQEQVKPRQQD